ncbi:CinA family nicotinamide mononucleotide deamidase-related protein, partial [bacterium]|nr:CinA family nicotinamide mononucleotide deamidase-related protein [bacterium]
MDSKVAEIISAGTELLLGEIIDTNAVFLAQKLRDLGIFLFFKSTVGDNRERLAETIKRAFNRCDVVITTGGLGPTEDDLTREAISDVMGETPTENTELIRKLSELFSSRKRPMPEINRKQAWLIPSAVPLENPIGTACGWYIEKGGKTIIALPGPPHEMEKMWNERVVPRLPKPSSCIYYTTFHALGLGEGNIAQLLKEFTSISNPSVATYARVHGVDVRIAANSSSIETARELAFPVERQVYSLIRDYIYGRDGDSIGQVIGRLLTDKSQTIGVIESLTGGLIS